MVINVNHHLENKVQYYKKYEKMRKVYVRPVGVRFIFIGVWTRRAFLFVLLPLHIIKLH